MKPKQNRFQYSVFMFCIDLDEVAGIATKIPFISHNRFNLFNFRDSDHLQVLAKDAGSTESVKNEVIHYIKKQGADTSNLGRIMLITNLCTLGYQFNPVSFYFCYSTEDKPLYAVVEVRNTFHEMKLYFLDEKNLDNNKFSLRTTKHFYVSPFIAMDTEFDFNLNLPGEDLKININDFETGALFFTSTVTGTKKQLTSWNVLKYAIRFPFITLQIITLIHWQALKLWLKKINYFKKASFVELQKEVLRPHKSLMQ